MGRPTKRNPAVESRICEHLRNGSTRRAAAGASGVAYETFRKWVNEFPAFSADVTRAEDECEARFAAVLSCAADGVPYDRKTVTTKTVIQMRTTKLADGSVITEPVAIEDRTEQVVSGVEYDWRAAESWLKRRRRDDWGDNLNLGRMSDEDLIAAAASLVAGSGSTGTAAGAFAGGAVRPDIDD